MCMYVCIKIIFLIFFKFIKIWAVGADFVDNYAAQNFA